jgi:hypothetical protein
MRMIYVLSMMGSLAWPALAQQNETGARPGNEIGTGMSLPRSDRAGNLDAATTHSALAPNLPAPQNSGGVRALLMEARQDLAADRSGAAQEALERAETRALDRSVPVGSEHIPAGDPVVSAVSQARAALAAGNMRGAIGIIDAALPQLAAE